MLFGYPLSKLILVSGIDSEISEKILHSVRITFKKITKYKSLYLKINFNQINFI